MSSDNLVEPLDNLSSRISIELRNELNLGERPLQNRRGRVLIASFLFFFFFWCEACGVIAQRLHHGLGREISRRRLRVMLKASLRGFCWYMPRLRVLLRLSPAGGFLRNELFL